MHARLLYRLVITASFITATSLSAMSPSSGSISIAEVSDLGSKQLQGCTEITAAETAILTTFLNAATSDDALKALASQTPPAADLIRRGNRCPEDLRAAPRALSEQALAGINQSAILWGLTDFLLKRANQEVDDWFFTDLRAQLCATVDPSKPALQAATILPATCKALLQAELADILKAPSLLRAAARDDLRVLPQTASAEIRRITFLSPTSPNRDLAGVIAYLGEASSQMITGQNAVGAFASGAASTLIAGLAVATEPVTIRLYQLSYLLEGMQTKDKFVVPQTPDDYRRLVMAVAVNASGRGMWNTMSPLGLTQLASGVGVNLLSRLASSAYMVADANRALEAALKKASDSAQILSAYAAAFDSVAALSIEWLKLCGDKSCVAVAAQLAALERFASLAVQGDYAGMLVRFAAVISPAYELPPDLTRGVQLLIALASANDAKGASDAITALAAPAGGYRVKRAVDRWYFRVNAYVGAGYSSEKAAGQWSTALGPWVPVGLELGHGKAWPGSWGVFGQVIDIGVLASYRVQQSDVSHSPEVGFKQVFAPGAFLVVGVKGIPLSIAGGVSYAPELRTLETASSSTTQVDATRYSVNVALDLPLFP